MSVYLWDRLYKPLDPANSSWHGALGAAFRSLYVVPEVAGSNGPPGEHAAYSRADAILFVHSGDRQGWVARASKASCHIVLVRGGGGEGKSSNKKGNLHGCSWGPDDFLDLTRNQKARRFVDQVLGGGKIDWTLLLPGDDSLLALHLIFQGFLAAEARGHGKAFWGENERLFGDLLTAAEVEVGRTSSLIGTIKASVKGQMPTRGGVTVALRALAQELGYPDAP